MPYIYSLRSNLKIHTVDFNSTVFFSQISTLFNKQADFTQTLNPVCSV